MTRSNYHQFKKDNKLFVLGLSSSDPHECTHCCTTEHILSDAKMLFDKKTFVFDTKKKNQKI